MKRATEINEISSVFKPESLQENNLEMFYYDGTMKSRVGVDYVSPIEDIFESCTTTPKSAYLLLGHKGCGKTTELNMLKKRLVKENYLVKDINCSIEMDMMSPNVWDFLVLITEKLLRIAYEIKCEVNKQLLYNLLNFFKDKEETKEFVDEARLGIEGGVETESPSLLKSIINLFVKISAEVKVGETTKTVIREVVEKRASVWKEYVSSIADVIADRNGGKRPVLIIEDVEKMNITPVSEIFYKYAPTISGMPFHTIFTFPISLSYHPDFTSIRGYFSYKTLPMIKIKLPDNSEYIDGIKAIRTIIEKRASLELFAEGVIDLLIKKTGGSLRDLFMVIINAGKRARNRGVSTIEFEDSEWALSEMQSELTRMIDGRDYQYLINIIKSPNKKLIENNEHLLKMLQALVVLEYHNGKRWQDVHPLVTDFLIENVMNEKETK